MERPKQAWAVHEDSLVGDGGRSRTAVCVVMLLGGSKSLFVRKCLCCLCMGVACGQTFIV